MMDLFKSYQYKYRSHKQRAVIREEDVTRIARAFLSRSHDIFLCERIFNCNRSIV